VGQPLWAGVDAGKSDHYCVVIDADGKRLLSRRVANDEAALLELINAITALADGDELTWAIDLNAGGAALLIALLIGKRAEGKRHTQAVLALARRRLNVLWAMLRDHKPYQPTAPNAAAA
jgi:hypothetical protein